MSSLRMAALGAALVGLSAGLSFAQSPLERGRYLVTGIAACGNCHAARDAKGQVIPDRGLSGGMDFDAPVFKAYAPNITPDAETGIGKWTDAQLGKAIPGSEYVPWQAVFTPTGTPIAVIRRLNSAIAAAVAASDTKSRMSELGMAAESSSPEELDQLLRSEYTLARDLVKEAGLKLD